MTDGERKIWFPAKRYGYGWGFPVAWQGWLVLVVYTVMLIGGTLLFQAEFGLAGYLVYLFVISAALVAVCRARGEKPRWRWRKRGQ